MVSILPRFLRKCKRKSARYHHGDARKHDCTKVLSRPLKILQVAMNFNGRVSPTATKRNVESISNRVPYCHTFIPTFVLLSFACSKPRCSVNTLHGTSYRACIYWNRGGEKMIIFRGQTDVISCKTGTYIRPFRWHLSYSLFVTSFRLSCTVLY